MPMTKGLGWKRDGLDFRDRRYAAPAPITTALPPSVDLRGQMPPIEDQGQLGACTTFAIIGALRYEMIRQGEPDMPLSHLFLYYQERVLENTIGSDAGAEIRDGMKVVAGQGVPPETAWPYDPLRFAETPPPAAYAAATAHEALEYRSVPLDLVQLQGCMAEGYPVVLGISVFESFMSDAVAHSNGLIPLPATSEQNLGGHAVALCGYDNSIQRFILRNSWSTSWADRGYGYIPFAYILDANLTADAWTIRRTT